MLNFDQVLANSQTPRTTEEEEHLTRVDNVNYLMNGIIGRHFENFEDPQDRIDFMRQQSAKNFFRLSQHINARLRGETPHKLRRSPEERLGGRLPMLHTPAPKDKLGAFSSGFNAIQEYIGETDDSIEKQIEGVAMASEALIIWVHPFGDGNGRVSRFVGKFLEEGAIDPDSLIEETVSEGARSMVYGHQKLASRESRLAIANDSEMAMDEPGREEMRKDAAALPSDVDAMYLSVKRLLEEDSVRNNVLKNAENRRANWRLVAAKTAGKVVVAA